jgi:hypothetical protein
VVETLRRNQEAECLPGYDEDLVAWARTNAALLRSGHLEEIDAANLAEELDDLGKSERRALCSHIRVLLLHLLKWQFQAKRRSRSWQSSIVNARREIQVIVEDSPSLRSEIAYCGHREYPSARRLAAIETGIDKQTFPHDGPYTSVQLLDDGFFPE